MTIKLVNTLFEFDKQPMGVRKPYKMGCFKFEGQKFLWYYEDDLYDLMPMVRVDKAY